MNGLADFPELVPGHRPDLQRAIEAMPASRALGLQVVGFSPRGRSVVRMPIEPRWTFDGRSVQGGIVGTLADYAGVSAAAATLGEGWMASTAGFEVHNVAPAHGEALVAIGRSISAGRSIMVSRAEVYAVRGDDAVLVAVATTTCRPFEPRPGQVL